MTISFFSCLARSKDRGLLKGLDRNLNFYSFKGPRELVDIMEKKKFGPFHISTMHSFDSFAVWSFLLPFLLSNINQPSLQNTSIFNKFHRILEQPTSASPFSSLEPFRSRKGEISRSTTGWRRSQTQSFPEQPPATKWTSLGKHTWKVEAIFLGLKRDGIFCFSSRMFDWNHWSEWITVHDFLKGINNVEYTTKP